VHVSLCLAVVRFKVIDTDYNTTAIIYQCHGVWDDGTCRRQLEQVDILSRQPLVDPDPLSRRRVYDVVKERLCVDFYEFVQSATGRAYSVTQCLASQEIVSSTLIEPAL